MQIGMYTLDELHKMLDSAKKQNATLPLIPLIKIAIDAEEQRITNRARDTALLTMRPQYNKQEIVIRAMNIDTWCKDRHCVGIYYPVDDHFVFELEQTKRWFSLCKFLPRVGYHLIPEDSDCKFVITSIRFHDKRPKKTIFTAVPAKAA